MSIVFVPEIFDIVITFFNFENNFEDLKTSINLFCSSKEKYFSLFERDDQYIKRLRRKIIEKMISTEKNHNYYSENLFQKLLTVSTKKNHNYRSKILFQTLLGMDTNYLLDADVCLSWSTFLKFKSDSNMNIKKIILDHPSFEKYKNNSFDDNDDIKEKNKTFENVVSKLIDMEYYSTANILIEAGNVNNKLSALSIATKKGAYDIFLNIITHEKIPPQSNKNIAIRNAAENGRYDILKYLLQFKHINPAACENYSIRKAAENGHLNCVKLLIKDSRVNPAACNNYAIKKAIRKQQTLDYYNIVELLLNDKRVNPNRYKYHDNLEELFDNENYSY